MARLELRAHRPHLEAIRQRIWEEMERNPTVFYLGEDIGICGGFIDRFSRGALSDWE